MGGFTKIQLIDRSQENIDAHNTKLRIAGVPKKYRFYSERDIIEEYEYFKAGEGVFEERFFPRDKIRSYQDFKKYWSTEALGQVFVPPHGALTFDCYFGRTSKRAMRNIARYVVENHRAIDSVEGSWETFLERGPTKLEREIIEDSMIKENW